MTEYNTARHQRQKQAWYFINKVRLDHEDGAALREICKKQNKGLSEKIREYVTWGLMNEEEMNE